MKTYPLGAFESQGMRFTGCVLGIDEDAGRYVVWRRTGILRRGRAEVLASTYGEGTEVVLADSSVRVSGAVITPDSAALAKEISDVIGRPRAVKLRRESEIAAVQSASLELLRARESAIAFLIRLKADPKGTLLSASGDWTDASSDPVESIVSARSREVSDAFAKFNAALGKTTTLGSDKIGRLCAIAYCMGLALDSSVGGTEDLKPKLSLLKEITGRDVEPKDLQLGQAFESAYGAMAGAVLSSQAGPTPTGRTGKP